MASRQVKKLLKQAQEQELLRAPEEDSSSEGEEEEAAPFNPFDLLNEDEDQPAVEQEDEEEEEQQEREPARHVTKSQPAPGSAGSKKKAGKKKGKGKGKKCGAAQGEDPGDGDETAPQGAQNDDELAQIDRLVQELNLKTVGAQESSGAGGEGGQNGTTSAGASGTCALLAVDPQALKGEEELRRIFGASVVAAVDREELADAARRRRNAMQARGRPAAAAALRRANRKCVLVVPKEHWPPLDNNISMEFVGVEDGVRCFRYVWSPNYQHMQRAFERCQASHDPNAIAALLQHAPYHVDALLSMYELYRHLGENQYAEEVLHRALHALEVAWHPQFDVRTAQCRLDFEIQENRPLFLALFRHVQGLSRAGCHRTALECAKLLLALQPEDPMGVLCMMDYLAIRAGRYEYLHSLVEGWEADEGLAYRPNIAYGLALASYRIEQQQQQSGQQDAQEGGRKAASRLLLEAILMHPSVVPKILSKLQEKGTGREASWTALLQRKLFTKPHDAHSPTLQHLSSIYAERSSLLWKGPDALEWLRGVATRAADISEAGSIRRSGNTRDDSGDDSSVSAADWKGAREQVFPDGGPNEFRHLRLADFTDNVSALPREELGPVAAPPDAAAAAAAAAAAQAPGGRRQRGGARGAAGAAEQGLLDIGDLDPQVLEEIQEQLALAQMQQQQQGQGNGGQAMTDAELQNANPLMMLLRSLMPWVNVGQQPDYAADDQEDDGEEGGAANGQPPQ